MRASCLTAALLFCCPGIGLAATTSVNSLWTDGFGSGSIGPLRGALGTPLTGGNLALPSDGAVLQFGYFAGVPLATDPATYGPAEWAAFTPVTGLGSANPHIATSIGDGAAGGVLTGGFPDGFYSIGITFDTATETGLPVAPSRIGIRYFDTTTQPDGSAFFNTVTVNSSDWVMSAPADTPSPPANASLDARVNSAGEPVPPPLVWEDNANPFMTSIPEPSTSLLGLLGLALLLRRRR